jgi:hypothetical protein
MLVMLILLPFSYAGCTNKEAARECLVSVQFSQEYSADKLYSAKILQDGCAADGGGRYILGIDAVATKEGGAWHANFPLEQDDNSMAAPKIFWNDLRSVVVVTRTRTISGSIRLNLGADLHLTRIYVADSPNSLPNY